MDNQVDHHTNAATEHAQTAIRNAHREAAAVHAQLAIAQAIAGISQQLAPAIHALGLQLAPAFANMAKPAPPTAWADSDGHIATTPRPPVWPHDPDSARFRGMSRGAVLGEAPGLRALTCACGSREWARYPARSGDGRSLDWWVCGNTECFRVVDSTFVQDDGSPVYVFDPSSGTETHCRDRG